MKILLLGHVLQKKIFFNSKFVESLAELSESIRVPSSVITFVVIDVFKLDKAIVNVTLENDTQWPLYLLMSFIITPIKAGFQINNS